MSKTIEQILAVLLDRDLASMRRQRREVDR